MQRTAKRALPVVGLLLLAASCGESGPGPSQPGAGSGGSGGASAGQGGSAGVGGQQQPTAGASGLGGMAGAGELPDGGTCPQGTVTVYRDADGDGRHGAEQVICANTTPPDGFDETTVGPDVDDADGRSWTQASLDNCRDEDGDGFFVDCDQPPLGAPDCNDDAGFIRPGGIETLGGNFDCDPSTSITVDDAHGVFIAPGGDDTDPCGTAADPCATFAKAESMLLVEPAESERRFIFAAAGDYNEGTFILRHSAIGGFNVEGSSWTRPAFTSRPETAAGLSVIFSATTDQERLEVSGDGIVLDGIGVDGPPFTGNCTGINVLGPTQDAPPLTNPRGVLIVHGHVRHECGSPDSLNLTALRSGHRVIVARTTLQIADEDIAPPPANLYVVDLAPYFDPWLEDVHLSVAQAATNRYGLRVSPPVDGIVVHLRNSRIHMSGAPAGNSYGVHIFDADVVADGVVVTDDNDTGTGALNWGMRFTGNGEDAMRVDVLRSRLDVEQTPLGLEQAQANVVQSLLDSKGGSEGGLLVSSGSRLNLVHSLVRAVGTSPVALKVVEDAADVAVANSIFDVQMPDRAVVGISNAGTTPLRLFHNVFFLDGDTDANECPVNVAGAACGGGFALNDCSTWTTCGQSTGNLQAALSYAAGGTSGGTFEPWHLPAGSPCIDLGQAPHALLPPGVPWLRRDVDGDPRPSGVGWDVGLDERPASAQ